MKTTDAIAIMQDIINKVVADYKLTKASKDANGTYIPLPIESVTQAQEISALNFGVREAALQTTPLTLIENVGSTASIFKMISQTQYIRVPSAVTADGVLDIDEALSYAVIFTALGYLDNSLAGYTSNANSIYANYNDATRDYFIKQGKTTTIKDDIYFRYSSDGTNWHDTYISGDIYISFMQTGGVWSKAIRFVGKDGAAGSGGTAGATTFLALTDTPSAYTANKRLAIDSTGKKVVFADEYTPTYSTDGIAPSADTIIDFTLIPPHQIYYVYAGAALSIDITQVSNTYQMTAGRIYTLQIFPNSYAVTLKFKAKGNTIIDKTKSATVIRMFFDTVDIYILDNVAYA